MHQTYLITLPGPVGAHAPQPQATVTATGEQELRRLLEEYGPSHPTTPAYPFHQLVSDGVWEVRADQGLGSPGSGVRVLRSSGATGRLAPELRTALRREPALMGRLARVLLDFHFPPSPHADLCEAVGLDLDPAEAADVTGSPGGRERAARRQRDRRMRELVLTAYEFQCAFCGYDGMLGAGTVGLEAAHVRWLSYDGPDEVDNGLGLCSLHHKLFDKGVLGLGEGRRILVSQRFVGRTEASRQHVLALAGRPVIGPQAGVPPVAGRHRQWHVEQVFRGEAREPLTPAYTG
ncbi:phosphorothioated DNA-binding restriction endonuclease [Kitasatospora sp. NPDC059973]|uniref:phosphorothioated DNA-binding restriction endonuclease n=1 Tax=Kitasatospora sp. NPDC059973 TaxID=3347020 RepID=UPI0036935C0F